MEENHKLICEILQMTNGLNNSYCNIFDECNSQRIGQNLDYINIISELSRISFVLEQTVIKRKSLNNDNEPEIERIIKALTDYQDLLSIRIHELNKLVKKLYDKAEAIGERYTIFTYFSDMKKLKIMEQQTIIIGDTLQNVSFSFMQRYC